MIGCKRLLVGSVVLVAAAWSGCSPGPSASAPATLSEAPVNPETPAMEATEATEATPLAFDAQQVSITSRDSYYYQVPDKAGGMVYLLHGGGGQATDWFKRTETRYLWEHLVNSGYGVVSIDSTLGLDEGWANPLESSAGLDRVDWVTNDLKQRGLLRDGMHEYGIGASGGGNFLSFLHRRCDLEAVASVSSLGKGEGLKEIDGKPAVLFVIGANDKANPVEKVRKASDRMNQKSVPSEVVVLEPRALTAKMVARIPGLSVSDGENIVERLKSNGVISRSGMVSLDSMKYDKKILGEYSKYKPNLSEQLEIAAAGHVFDRQHADDIQVFFDTHR